MTTRLLETGFETKFHALQVIFVRMLATAVIGSLYMWYKNVPAFPLGPPGVRKLLVLRGFAGSSGLFGLYCMCIRETGWVRHCVYLLTLGRLLVISGHIRRHHHYVPGSHHYSLRMLGCAESKFELWIYGNTY